MFCVGLLLTRINWYLLFFSGLSCFEGLVSRFREFWSRTCNRGNLLLGKDEFALIDYHINVTMRIEALTPLAKICVLRRAENNEAISEISGNLLKSHKEVILINLAIPLVALSLYFETDNLGDEVIVINLIHAIHFCPFLILEGSAVQLLKAEEIWLCPMCLWFNHVHRWFLCFYHLLSAVFKTDLCVFES